MLNALDKIEIVPALPASHVAGVLYLVEDGSGGFNGFVAGRDGESGYLNGGNATIASRADLADITGLNGDMRYLSETGREGWFKFSAANLSANVTADTYQGIYIAPTSASSGASGAWIRVLNNPKVFRAAWFGISSANSETVNTAIADTIFPMLLPGNATLIMPDGVIPVRLRIPNQTATYLSSIIIIGETGVATWFGTVAGPPYTVSTKGTILSSTAAAPSATSGGIIEALNTGTWSNIKVVVKDLTLRTYDNPNQHGIMAQWAQQLVSDGNHIDTSVWGPGSASLPTHVVWAIRTPENNNGAFSYVNNTSITGYYVGMTVNEHTEADNLNIQQCKYGLEYLVANHASHLRRVNLEQNQVNLLFDSGVHHFRIDQLNIEHAPAGAGWTETTYDIYDPNNYGLGSLEWSVVKGNVGQDTTFTVNGATNISYTRIGTNGSPVGVFQQPADQSIPNAALTAVDLGTASITECAHVKASNHAIIVIDVPGLYNIYFAASFASNATGYRQLDLYIGGTNIRSVNQNAINGAATNMVLERQMVTLAVGDEISVGATQNSGGALNLLHDTTIAAGVLGLKYIRNKL